MYRSRCKWPQTLFGCVVALFQACTEPDTTGIRLVGHGGLGPNGAYPMNSAAALKAALDQGLDGIELDVQLTADSVLVAHHELQVSHGQGCQGRVNDLVWDDLKHCADPSGGPGAFRGVRVDSLVLRLARLHPQAEFTFDVKLNTAMDWWPYLHAFTAAITKVAQHAPLHGRIVVECRTTDFLQVMHEQVPEMATFLYVDDVRGAVRTAQEFGCQGIIVELGRINEREAEEIRSAGLQLTLFGVEGAWDRRRAVALHPDRIQVDR